MSDDNNEVNKWSAIDTIADNLRSHELLHPCVIDSCTENAHDMGLREDVDPDAFWGEVYAELLGELDAAGLDSAGLPR